MAHSCAWFKYPDAPMSNTDIPPRNGAPAPSIVHKWQVSVCTACPGFLLTHGYGAAQSNSDDRVRLHIGVAGNYCTRRRQSTTDG
eukprot:CAMPEP_0174385878 /NCGR_PEP_ID=MMETSP0811_2-20130205/126901_1 /TAXON_ID=73025 ORGANISM="Eutreptiella gymnastica-like, Strain CCMP1594" /NCGR_SAMPLE_ID=MMETSP0811_2 /ASSEMBLY_ACC=CAM_ASM_000667 /LENGTH=84 /DNA_ID=CAMNT_0015540357 /DNA_START=16 /DNA_END=270 /DNA_ORIENTATION=+